MILWNELRSIDVRDKKNTDAKAYECQTWWENNCLFWEPEARNAFKQAYLAAMRQATLYQQNANGDELKKEGEIIRGAVNLIQEGVELPEIKGNENE